MKKKKRAVMLAASAVVALLVSLILNNMMNGDTTLNPFRWIAGIFVYGFPAGLFLVIFAAFAVLCLYADYKASQELEEDPRGFKYSKNGTYGTARVLRSAEEIKEVALVQDAAHACGTIFGQMDMTGKQIINQNVHNKANHRNKHIAVFGASSSGKTYSFVMPFCFQALRRRESLIITDPKGELYEETAEYFRNDGYIVRRFDLKKPILSDGWDLLAEVFDDPDRISIMADTIWHNLEGTGKGGVFDSGPKSLLMALITLVALDETLPPEEKTIENVYGHLVHPDGEKHLEDIFNPARIKSKKAQAACKAYHTFKSASPNLRGSIMAGLSNQLNIFQQQTVCDVLSTPDIDLTLPGKRPCVYYCILADMHETYRFVSALFFSFLFQDLVDYADSRPGRKCEVPVNFLLDEFANIGTIPGFDKKLATVRSRGLNITIILQDINQLKNYYENSYLSILSNCATHICIGFNDPETAKFFSERAGETTIQVRTDQHEKVEPAVKLGNKHSTGEGKRMVFPPDELMRLSMDKCIIIWQAMCAMEAYKYPYVNHPEASRLKHISYADYPPITDKESRRRLREDEEDRINAYNVKVENGYDPLAYFGAVRDYEDEPITDSIDFTERIRQEFATVIHYVKLFIKKVRYVWMYAEARANAPKEENIPYLESAPADLGADTDVEEIQFAFDEENEEVAVTAEGTESTSKTVTKATSDDTSTCAPFEHKSDQKDINVEDASNTAPNVIHLGAVPSGTDNENATVAEDSAVIEDEPDFEPAPPVTEPVVSGDAKSETGDTAIVTDEPDMYGLADLQSISVNDKAGTDNADNATGRESSEVEKRSQPEPETPCTAIWEKELRELLPLGLGRDIDEAIEIVILGHPLISSAIANEYSADMTANDLDSLLKADHEAFSRS